MLKALIVEDEYPARMELRYHLEPYRDQVEVVGEAQTAREALQLIAALEYDVVFLDIQMPGMSGTELAQAIRAFHPRTRVVFVTAHEEHALQAFEVNAVDYLLKPISQERFQETMRRLLGRPGGPPSPPSEARLAFVACEVDGRTIPVPVDDIVFISAEHEAIYLHTERERLPTRYTLQELADRLPPDQFFRTHRSFIANIRRVREIMPYFNGTYLLKMKDKNHSEVVVSRSNVKRLRELFNLP